MSDTSMVLAAKLRVEGVKTMQFFRELQDVDWEVLLYTDGANWRVKEILAHFVITEIGIPQIIRNVLGGGSGSPVDFNLDEFNRRNVRRLEDMSSSMLLENFNEMRRQTILLVEGMENEDLMKIGRHPFLGDVPLVDMIKLLYRHNQIHQRDIRRALADPTTRSPE